MFFPFQKPGYLLLAFHQLTLPDTSRKFMVNVILLQALILPWFEDHEQIQGLWDTEQGVRRYPEELAPGTVQSKHTGHIMSLWSVWTKIQTASKKTIRKLYYMLKCSIVVYFTTLYVLCVTMGLCGYCYAVFIQCISKWVVWYCAVLHCTELHCTALHCTALHCTVLYWCFSRGMGLFLGETLPLCENGFWISSKTHECPGYHPKKFRSLC